MELKGKCKIDFEKWCMRSEYGCKMYNGKYLSFDLDGNDIYFNDLPDSMQFGIIQDFADSVGSKFHTSEALSGGGYHGSILIHNNTATSIIGSIKPHKARTEARTEAVKQFVKYYNKG